MGKKSKASIALDAEHQMSTWRQFVGDWYPGYQERTYFVPPVYMNRMKYKTETFEGQIVYIPLCIKKENPAYNHVLEDQSIQHILHCLHALLDPHIADAQGEPVVVISQLKFQNYLDNFKYTTATGRLPRPTDLRPPKALNKKVQPSDSKNEGKMSNPNEKEENLSEGDFDILFVSKHYGLIAGEVKAVGSDFSIKTADEQDRGVAGEVQKAVKQLNKARKVLEHIVKDQQTKPLVRKALMLPNVTRFQLRRALNNYPEVRQNLCKCLEDENPADPADLCLTADELSDRKQPHDVTPEVITRLRGWWTRVVAAPKLSLTDDVYEDLVSRYHYVL